MYSLYSWGSPFESDGIYSFDPVCLSIQAYLQLSKAEWRLCRTNSTDISPSRCLPTLVYQGSAVESGLWPIAQFLKQEGHDLDAGLDPEQLAQSVAYISAVQGGLGDALLFSWYAVSENFVAGVRPQLAKLFGFPLSLVIPTQLKTYAERKLTTEGIISSGGGSTDDADSLEASSAANALRKKIPRIYLLAKEGFNRYADKSAHPIYEQAKKYLSVLSKKLGQQQYFFGNRATMLDTVVYGYLVLVIKIDLPQNTLKEIIESDYPNLIRHCDRIHEQLSAPTTISEQSLVAGLAGAMKQAISSYFTVLTRRPQEVKDDPQRAAKVRSVVGASFAFLGYVIYNGILSAPAPKPPSQTNELVFESASEVLSAIRNV
ncbi:hypothetical protein H4R24_002282 [Coemansia sp. RSA 988]|nr:hypothetical protein H4R24_002282 [Coemansia sp. RSA 988]